MLKHLSILVVVLNLSAKATAQALDPMTGVRIAVVSMQNVMGAMPLPSLGTVEKSHIPVQVGYQTAQVNGSVDDQTTFSGTFQGGVLGLGFNGRATRDLGFFAMVAGNQLNGSVDIHEADNTDVAFILDSSTQGLMLTTGLDARLIGDDKSFFALGLFAGPAGVYAHTSFETAAFDGSPIYHYSADLMLYGGVAGLQTEFRLWNFVVAPYGMYFYDSSPQCKAYQTDYAGGSNPACGGSRAAPIPGSFAAFGFLLGYKAFRIQIYSQIFNDSSMQGNNIQNYQLSYTF